MVYKIFELTKLKVILLTAIVITFGVLSCTNKKENHSPFAKGKSDSVQNWVDWNVLFPAGTNEDQRNIAIEGIKNEIWVKLNEYAADNGVAAIVTFRVTVCRCDTLLYLLEGDLDIWGTTG